MLAIGARLAERAPDGVIDANRSGGLYPLENVTNSADHQG